MFGVKMQQTFRVAVGSESPAQLIADGLEVIDFSVERDRQPAIVAVHRLMAGGREVDDAEASRAQGHIVANPFASVVRATMNKFLVHAAQHRRRVTQSSDESADPAHGYFTAR